MSLTDLSSYKSHIEKYGFSVINAVFSEEEVAQIIHVLDNIDTSKENFRKSEDLFAIRQFLKKFRKLKTSSSMIILKQSLQRSLVTGIL